MNHKKVIEKLFGQQNLLDPQPAAKGNRSVLESNKTAVFIGFRH